MNKHISIKVKLEKLLWKKMNYDNLYDAITRTNILIDNLSLFIRSYILYVIEYNKNNEEKISEPIVDIDFIRIAFSIISNDDSPKKGRPFNENKTYLLNQLKTYFAIFKEKTNMEITNANKLSYILGQTYEQIYISIINNIIYHFDKHVWKFIKASNLSEYGSIKIANDSNKLTEFYSEMAKIKNDLFNNSLTSNIKYHDWINSIRQFIIPYTYIETKFETDVNKNTFSYLKCMQYINNYIQSKDLKSYQIFPLKTSCYNNHVKINTSALIDLFYGSSKLNE